MTERIYYTDPSCREFDAVVTETALHEGRHLAVLDRTAFYPTSGGQPNDTGALGGVRVLDVLEREDGSIGHVIEGELAAGRTVRGTIDWRRRFDHMQQHTGQHILSAALDRLHKARTVGFHLGSDVSTLDLDRDLGAAAMTTAEDEANRVVWENRPVTIRFANEREAAALPLRKETGRVGELRLIAVEDFDLSACGGTHVARTGEVGIIVVRAWERFRGGCRVEFLCGGRALASCRVLRDSVAGVIRHLSVLPHELPEAVERAQSETKDLRKTIRGLQEELAAYEAAALAARAADVGGTRLVIEALEGKDAPVLKAMALAIVQQPGFAVALFSRPAPALAVVARSADLALDAPAVLKALVARFGGKGGGRPDLAQGGGLTGTLDDMMAAARDALTPRG